MTLFNSSHMQYTMISPHVGKRATVSLFNGKSYNGEIVEVRRDGILFHSDNPGFLFLPFLAIAALALTVPFAYGAGYGVGSRYGRPPYGYGYGGYGYGRYPYPYPY